SLGATPIVIGATFLASAAIETGLSPLAGRLSDRRGRYFPVRISLLSGVAVSLLAPVLSPAAVLIAMLVIGMPAFGTLFAPSSAMLSDAAHRLELHQGLAFGLANLAWAAGQTIAASASGAIAQATTDVVPYALLAATCLATFLATLRSRVRAGQSCGPSPPERLARGRTTRGSWLRPAPLARFPRRRYRRPAGPGGS